MGIETILRETSNISNSETTHTSSIQYFAKARKYEAVCVLTDHMIDRQEACMDVIGPDHLFCSLFTVGCGVQKRPEFFFVDIVCLVVSSVQLF